MEGVLKLEFASRNGVTEIVDRYQQAPLHVQKVLHPHLALPGMAWVHILTVTGGIVQGDRFRTEIVARDGTQVHLTTPGATKIYRSPAAPASHCLTIRAGADTHVEYLPGPVIPFRGARFLEEVTLMAHPTATLMYGSILTSGRVAMGESHAYDLFSSRVTAQRDDGVLEFLDVTHLAPASVSPTLPGLLGSFDVLGTLHVVTGKVSGRDLGDRLHGILQDLDEGLAGVTELPSGRGVTVRVLGPRAEPVASVLQAVLTTARATLLQEPEPRAAEPAPHSSPTTPH
jgi:urease accessory protein